MAKEINLKENDIESEVLFKSNTLIKSNISITSVEYKIFNKILYKCQIEKGNENHLMAVLTVKELGQIVLNKKENTLNSLAETLEKFVKTPIKFEKNKSYVITTLINKVVVNKKDFTFYCYLDKDLYDVLMGYKEIGYSPINLKMMREANGYYTQRFYELFRIWSGHSKEVTYDIEKLKTWLMIKEGTAYDRYYNFKVKVIQPSLKEINKKMNMKVDYVENKIGRAVRSITFKIEDLEPRKYSFSKDEIVEAEAAIDMDYSVIPKKSVKKECDYEKLLKDNKIKISPSTLSKLKEKYGQDLLKSSIEALCKRHKEIKITAPVRYLKAILENNRTSNSEKEKPESEVIEKPSFYNKGCFLDGIKIKITPLSFKSWGYFLKDTIFFIESYICK